MRPCKHRPPLEGCKVCFLHKNDARYQKLWGPYEDQPTTVKPRLSFDELAQMRHRCRERERLEGVPCPYTEKERTVVTATTSTVKPLAWAYGVTTVQSRLKELLPRTLASLATAGFDRPRLFVDGVGPHQAGAISDATRLDVTHRWPNIGTFGNWTLALAELWIRESDADRYAIFQDDFVTYRNLRQYLDAAPYPDRGYLNLYTFPSNSTADQHWSPPMEGQTGRPKIGFYEAREAPAGQGHRYVGRQMQFGRGAVALVFNRAAVTALLAQEHMVTRVHAHVSLRQKKVDGGVVTAMNKAGFREYVHHPSLTQHIGTVSSMGNKPHLQATTFRGEGFDAVSLLREG